MLYDTLIIGAGAVGCAVARELSRLDMNVAVVEKESDVAAGTSGRNSAVVHAGFNNKPGSLMAELCVEGNQGFEKLCRELDVPYRKTGKYVVAFDEADVEILNNLLRQGTANGCRNLRIIGKDELHAVLPDVGGIAALESPETAVFDPFLYTVALAENAAVNGVKFHFDTEVLKIDREEGWFKVTTSKGEYTARHVVNCAGLYSDKVSSMAGCDGYKIHFCKGEYLILDKIADEYLKVPVYPVPKKGIGGLGVHLTPTIHGNVIIGPSAEYLDEEDYSSTREIMDKLFSEAQHLLPTLQRKHIIGAYSGIRSKQAPANEGGFHDFVIKEEPSCPGFINLVGIESPGMTASAPIARRVRKILLNRTSYAEKKNFVGTRKGIVKFSELSDEQKDKLIREDGEYGEIVCRCQQVTKKEIKQAIENPLGVKTLSAIKYRVWPTTGRCNGGYCLSYISDILVKEYGMKPEEISLRGNGSELYSGKVK